MDKRDKTDIFEEIMRVSRIYAPEWSAPEGCAGRALALLFSELIAENYARLPDMIRRHRLLYLNMYGLSKKPALPARGYISVTPTADNVILLKSGSRAGSLGSAADAEFVTESDLCAVNTRISSVFCTAPGVICRGSERRLFDLSGENTQETALYFSSEDILYGGGAFRCQVTILDISAADQNGKAPNAVKDPAEVRWQYLTPDGAKDITEVRFEDGAFTLDIPEGVPETELSGERGKWLKLIFTGGEIPGAVSKGSVQLSAEISDAPPSSVYLNENMLAERDFFPFGEQPSEYDCFYICGSEVFGKGGSRVTVRMELTFGECAVSTGEGSSVRWKTVIPMSELEKKPPLEKRIEGAVWEYWNGRGWRRIYPDDAHTADFADKTAGKAEITFICPKDMEQVSVGADQGLFIRCRVTKITPGYAWDMVYVVPRCGAVSLSCTYEGRRLPADSLFVSRDMELRNADGEAVSLPRTEDLANSFTYLCLERGIPEGYYNMYFRVKSSSAPQQTRWEALSSVRGERRWQPLHVRDMTAGLSESGMVTLRVEYPMCAAALYGETGFWLRISAPSPASVAELDGIVFNAVPVIQHSRAVSMTFPVSESGEYVLSSGGIYSARVFLDKEGGREELPPERYSLDRENGVIRIDRGYDPRIPDGVPLSVEFTVTGGAEGNLPAGEINSFLDPVPFVDFIENPEPTYGGRSVEDFSDCEKRGAENVRTLERCVSESDLETAARRADPAITRAKCRGGEGGVSLILLTDRNDISVFRLARQNVLNAVLPAVPFYLRDRLEIKPAAYVEIDVTAHILSDGEAFPQTIQSDIRARLGEFLDPVSGNDSGAGFEIGEYPDPESAAAVILSADHVISADKVRLLCRYRGKVYDVGRISSDVPDGVPVCGNITVYISETGETWRK